MQKIAAFLLPQTHELAKQVQQDLESMEEEEEEDDDDLRVTDAELVDAYLSDIQRDASVKARTRKQAQLLVRAERGDAAAQAALFGGNSSEMYADVEVC